MRTLGYYHQAFNLYIFREWFCNGSLDKVLHHALSYDSFDDLPYNRIGMIEIAAIFFPNSKFVLLECNNEDLVWSFTAHASGKEVLIVLNDYQLVEWYESRNLYLKNFFNAREFDGCFLSMNLFQGDGYDKLLRFLSKEVLTEEFPHLNKDPQV